MSESEDDNYPFDWRSGDFITWIKQQPGARVNPAIRLVDLRSRGAGRGIVASADIEQDAELFTIALTNVLSVKNSSLIKTHLGPTVLQLDDWLALTLALLFEKGQKERSKWSTYLDILPTTFDTLMHWTEPELMELAGCAVVKKIGRSDAEKAFCDHLLPIIKKNAYMFPQFQPSETSGNVDTIILRHAHVMATLIMAYAFDLEEEQADGASDDDNSDIPNLPKAMVPLADMFNADGDRNNAHLIQSHDSLSMVTLKPIKNGQEIFNDYGQLPRSDLLRRYGYITDQYKKWDAVEIGVDMVLKVLHEGCQSDEQSLQQRSKLAEQWGVYGDSFELKRDGSPTGFTVERELYLFVDAFTMDPETLQEEIHAHEVPEEPRFTYEMGAQLKNILLARLKCYGTTIAEDAVLLQSDRLSIRSQMAIKVRLGEKELIVAALGGLQSQMDSISENVGHGASAESGDWGNEKSQDARRKKIKI